MTQGFPQFTPDRMSVMNVATGDVLDVQYNPTELDEELAINWNKLAVLGLSHMPQQYQQTDNHGFEFELAFRAWDASGNRLDDIQQMRRQILSWGYSMRNNVATVVGGAPPRLLFVWPTLVSMTCVMKKVHFKHTFFNRGATPVHSSARITLEEIRDFRLYSEDVLALGTQRSGQAAPGQNTGGSTYGGEID